MPTPSTDLTLYSLDLYPDYNHTLYFDKLEDQSKFFGTKIGHRLSNMGYVRKSANVYHIPMTIDEARKYNYASIINPVITESVDGVSYSSGGKTFYYFITEYEYHSDGITAITIQLDVIQTYLKDIDYRQCFVERIHTDSDEVGEHTVDEGLDTGEYIISDVSNINELNELCILVQATFAPQATTENTTDDVLASRHDGVFSGLGLYAVSMKDWVAWGTKLQQLSEWGKLDGIINMWMYPKSMVTLASGSDWDDGIICKEVDSTTSLAHIIERPDIVDGYKPKNNKLLCYPYNMLYCTNHSGECGIYRYEYFDKSFSIIFFLAGALTPESPVRIYPTHYKGCENLYEEGINLKSYPTCAWNSDIYKMWLAQNQNAQNLTFMTSGVSVAGGLASAIGGFATGNPVVGMAGIGTAYHGVTQVAGLLAERKDRAILPNEARGTYSTNVNIAKGYQKFTFYQKSVRSEYARIIDDYFTMYGYKVNRRMTPSPNKRENYTYIKTVGATMGSLSPYHSPIPGADLQIINSIFDKGVTFWRDYENICDYKVSNLPL